MPPDESLTQALQVQESHRGDCRQDGATYVSTDNDFRVSGTGPELWGRHREGWRTGKPEGKLSGKQVGKLQGKHGGDLQGKHVGKLQAKGQRLLGGWVQALTCDCCLGREQTAYPPPTAKVASC